MELKDILALMDHFDASQCAQLKFKTEGSSVELRKACSLKTEKAAAPQVPIASPATAPEADALLPVPEEAQAPGLTINAPLVGTFYHAPSPGEAPYAEVGQTVKKGAPIGLIEAMKMMNEVPAPCDCIIEEILIADGHLAAYDAPLVRVREA
jgi:acetyl-CoA carboxylase biotin carboxyl carrier protein